MNIALRIKQGWRYDIPNKHPSDCDQCGARLWIGPGGRKNIYCNAVHPPAFAINVVREGQPDVLLRADDGHIWYFATPEEAQTTANIESTQHASDEDADYKVVDA